jgi:hypothetical protein
VTTADEIMSLVRAKRRRRKFWAGVGRFVVTSLTAAVAAFADGWLFMLAVGVAHDHWLTSMPSIGYWWAVLIVWLARGVFSPIKRAKEDE